MNKAKLFIACVIASLLFVACSKTETGSHESVKLKVLKVFNAKQGKAIFRAYLVNWEGQEIVVEDNLVLTNYQKGDTVEILVMNHPYPRGGKDYNLLSFAVLSPRKSDKKK